MSVSRFFAIPSLHRIILVESVELCTCQAPESPESL